MDTIFISSKNSKRSDPYRPLLILADKINLKRSGKYVPLSNLSIYYKKFELLTPTWSEQFELPDGSYSVSDIQDYFEYIFKKAWRKD